MNITTTKQDPEGNSWSMKTSLTRADRHAIDETEEDAAMRTVGRLASASGVSVADLRASIAQAVPDNGRPPLALVPDDPKPPTYTSFEAQVELLRRGIADQNDDWSPGDLPERVFNFLVDELTEQYAPRPAEEREAAKKQ